MTKAVTLRLDEADHAALCRHAERLRVRPGTMARMLVHAGLSGDVPELRRADAHTALDRLVQRSRRLGPVDAAGLLQDARADLGAER